jgi:microcystin-dependent protein
MPLESATYISDLVATNPAHSDPLSQTDAHLRVIKAALLATFPSINGVVNVTDEQLNALAAGTLASLTVTGALTAGSLTVSGAGTFGSISGPGAVPMGMVADFLNYNIPSGWYELNGQAVSRTGATAGLFGLYGTFFGAGDGSTTFNLPDLSQYFRRTSKTTDAVLGQKVADAIKSHTAPVSVSGGDHNHTLHDPGHAHTVPGYSGAGVISSSPSVSGNPQYVNFGGLTGTSSVGTGITLDSSGSLTLTGTATYTGSTETNPKFIWVVTCVKA